MKAFQASQKVPNTNMGEVIEIPKQKNKSILNSEADVGWNLLGTILCFLILLLRWKVPYRCHERDLGANLSHLT